MSEERIPTANVAQERLNECGGGRVESQVSKVKVTHLTRNVTSEHLHEIFGNYGKVVEAVVVTDARSKVSKGFGFVEFARRNDAEAAIKHMNAGKKALISNVNEEDSSCATPQLNWMATLSK